MTTSGINQAIKREQQNISILGNNAAGTAADVHQALSAGPGGLPKVSYVRATDNVLFKASLKGEAGYGLAETRNAFFLKINEALGDPHGGRTVGSEGFEDARSINHLFTSMLARLDVSDITEPQARQNAVNGVQGFLSSVSTYQSKLDTITEEAENEISRQIAEINANLKLLYQNNTKITFRGAREDNDVISSSEDIVHTLSRFVGLSASFSDGRVSARGTLGVENMDWVNSNNYVQLSYNSSSADKIQISVIDGATGNIGQTLDVEIRDSDGKTLTGIGGSLQGILAFRDTDLVAAKKDISDTMENVAFALNKMHNEGAGFPPATLVSAAKVLATDTINGSGKFKIAAFQASGQPLASAANSGGNVLPIEVDIGNTSTVAELVAKINKEAACAAQQGAALGDNVDSIAGKYLVSQAALDLTDIDTSGRASFGMRLESGSDHDVQFRFKNVVINDQLNGTVGNFGTLIDAIPTSFETLKAGETLNTSKIKFDIPSAGNKQELHIFAEVEVIGADGTFAVEKVHYSVDSGAVNGLLGFNNPNYLQATTAGTTFPVAMISPDAARPVARAAGAQVTASVTTDNKLNLAGRIAIMPDSTVPATIADSEGISRPFALHFGLNNLMNKNTEGRYEVRSDIVSDPNLLAWSKPQRKATVTDQNTNVGANTATGSFNLIAGLPADGDTVTINGETITFKTVAGGTYDANNPRHVLVQGTEAGTITELINRINAGALPAITALVTVAANVGNARIMDITAIRAGIKANAITLASTGGNLAVSGAFMVGGTDAAATTQRTAQDFRFVLTQNENAFATSIHSAVNFTDGNSMTVRNAFEVGFLIKVSNGIKGADSDEKVAKAVSEKANEAIQNVRKQDHSANLMAVMQSSQNMRMLAAVRALMMEAQKMLVNSIAAAA